jgi:alpha-glucosidase
MNGDWWKYSVFYHIYPISFQDSDGDGIGDIRGIMSRLDYLVALGVDAVWLSPVFRSPMVDGGYDISDYCDIDPLFGTLDDFRELLRLAHDKGIRVMMDLVMNHTSDQHAWFIESRSSVDNPKRDWYIWHTGRNGKAPNNWRTNFLESAWRLDSATGQYYYHSFFREQPDLNWRNEEMKRAFFDNIRFWLDLGVDGFRLDVVNMIVKDRLLRNNPLWFSATVYNRNQPETYSIMREFRALLDAYPGTTSVGEVYVLPPGNPKLAAGFLGCGDDMLHLAFDFSLLFCTWNARNYYRAIQAYYDALPSAGWPCFALSNHDMGRSLNRFGREKHAQEKAKLLAVMLLTIKGTPFIYYGDELGMTNVPIRRRQIRDYYGKMIWPLYKGRDQGRTPMPWNDVEGGGFTSGKPWMPLHKDFHTINVESETADENSVLNAYRRLIALRKAMPTLQQGEITFTETGKNGILSYTRTLDDRQIRMILNFSSHKRCFRCAVQEKFRLIYSTHRNHISEDRKIELSPFEGIVIEK